MKKRLVLFTLSLLLIVGMLSAGNAYAWFSTLQGGSQDVNRIKSGKIDYSLGGGSFSAADGEPIYPEESLLSGTISLSNASNIPTKLRVKVEYSIGSESGYWTSNTDCPLHVDLAGNNWNPSGDYLVYNGTVNPDQDVDLFSDMCVSGDNTDDDIEGESVTITVTYEAEQRQFKDGWG